MAEWIELRVALRDHHKIDRLSDGLKIPYAQAIGHMSCLWLWSVHNSPKGDLSKFASHEIAKAARFDGDPESFVICLRKSDLLDPDMKIHDWEKHGTRLIDQAKARIFRFRASKTSPQRGERGGKRVKILIDRKIERKKERRKEGKKGGSSRARYGATLLSNVSEQRSEVISPDGSYQNLVGETVEKMKVT